jgi:tetratricopeptide (TPR) repeat protein
MQMANAAQEQFQQVLNDDPKNELAIASIANLYFQEKKLDDARNWNQKLVELNPKSKEAYYTLGVIAWSKVYPVRGAARAKLGMKPEDPGPIKDKKVREELLEKNGPTIEEGLKDLDKALQLDPEYDDAMAYENLLYREKADLDDNAEQFKKDTETADNWVTKSLDTRKIKAERKPTGGGITAEAPK